MLLAAGGEGANFSNGLVTRKLGGKKKFRGKGKGTLYDNGR